MNNIILKDNQKLEVNSNEVTEVSYHFDVTKDATVIINLVGDNELTVNLEASVSKYTSFTLLLINNNNNKVKVNDKYDCLEKAQLVVAYSQLNSNGITTDSSYNLLERLASARVLSVSITSANNNFNQNCQHLADETKANVDNYGIVLANGNCQMIVKNTINKGFHNCDTHQTSRLLTYDKSAKGKILPILYIDDNEVAASHACSLGQPDENQLYYLQTRGLSYSEALRLITIGYLMPITKIVEDDNLNELLKNEIETKVAAYV